VPLLTFLSDFGSASPYPAAMKAAAASVAPQAVMLDITHDVAPGAVRDGAYLLWSVAPECPPGTVHCAVIDPGVGTQRAALAITSGTQTFVGPDNGVLLPAARRVGVPAVHRLTQPAYWRQPVSATFHGRDVFAPSAAHLAAGIPVSAVGVPAGTYVDLVFPTGGWEAGSLAGEVLWVDAFGNLITTIPGDLLAKLPASAEVVVETPSGILCARAARTFGDVGAGRGAVIVGSDGLVEVSVNRGRAAALLGAATGTRLRIRPN